MKKIILSLLIALISSTICSQNVTSEWIVDFGFSGNNPSSGQSITIDSENNIYSTGGFDAYADFDPNPNTAYNLTSTNGSFDAFIQKLDSDGNFIWAKSIGGFSTDIGESITTDASGNVYVTGQYRLTSDFDPGSGIFNMSSNGMNDIFIIKLDSNGNFIWAKSIGGTGVDYARKIIIDNSNNIYVTGNFSNTVDFDPGASTYNLTSNGMDAYILKLDSSGNFIWVKSVEGLGSSQGYSITTDLYGDIYATGSYVYTSDFDPGSSVFGLYGTFNSSSIFILKLDSSGNFIWAKRLSPLSGSSYNNTGYDITTDIFGDVLITGTSNDQIDYDPSTNTYYLPLANYSSGSFTKSFFILKLNSSGIFVWVKGVGGKGTESGKSIITDNLGSIYTTSTFESNSFFPGTDTVDFDPGISIFNLPLSNFGTQGIVQKLDVNGDFMWARLFAYGANNNTSINDNWIINDKLNNLYVIGDQSGITIQKLGQCSLSSNYTFTDNGNGNYSFTNTSTGNFNQSHWAFGDGTIDSTANSNHTFTTNADFTVVLTINNSTLLGDSCMSYYLDTINVTGVTNPLQCNSGFVMYPDTVTGDITVVNNSTGTNLTYLWDFGDGNTSTLQNPSHTYTNAGPFYLCLTVDDNNGCNDMYCDSIGKNGVVFNKAGGFNINVISIPISTGIENNIGLNSEIKIYPNPTSGQLTIDTELNISEANIIDITGKIIMITKGNTSTINVADLSDGIYFIQLITEERTITKKFIKQ